MYACDGVFIAVRRQRTNYTISVPGTVNRNVEGSVHGAKFSFYSSSSGGGEVFMICGGAVELGNSRVFAYMDRNVCTMVGRDGKGFMHLWDKEYYGASRGWSYKLWNERNILFHDGTGLLRNCSMCICLFFWAHNTAKSKQASKRSQYIIPEVD